MDKEAVIYDGLTLDAILLIIEGLEERIEILEGIVSGLPFTYTDCDSRKLHYNESYKIPKDRVFGIY
jgi:hypothetical protein